ncbi:hypothetical protein ON010_g15379 [Phytophthora cinnamomi]|nr:hypothetical protein ON010_g15379 [Phytophthora cinnamomi]
MVSLGLPPDLDCPVLLFIGDSSHRDEPRSDLSSLTFETDMAFARYFSDDGESELVDAVIGGSGWCQVQHIDLVFGATGAEERGAHGLTSFFIEVDITVSFKTDGLPQFIDAGGSSLKVLVLRGASGDFDENITLSSWPTLQELALHGREAVDLLDGSSLFETKVSSGARLLRPRVPNGDAVGVEPHGSRPAAALRLPPVAGRPDAAETHGARWVLHEVFVRSVRDRDGT